MLLMSNLHRAMFLSPRVLKIHVTSCYRCLLRHHGQTADSQSLEICVTHCYACCVTHIVIWNSVLPMFVTPSCPDCRLTISGDMCNTLLHKLCYTHYHTEQCVTYVVLRTCLDGTLDWRLAISRGMW